MWSGFACVQVSSRCTCRRSSQRTAPSPHRLSFSTCLLRGSTYQVDQLHIIIISHHIAWYTNHVWKKQIAANMSIAFGRGVGKSLILLLRPRVATFFLSVRVLLSFLIQPQYPLYLFLISRVAVDPELAAGGEEEITDKSCKMRYAQVSQFAYFLFICFSCKVFKIFSSKLFFPTLRPDRRVLRVLRSL